MAFASLKKKSEDWAKGDEHAVKLQLIYYYAYWLYH